MDLNSAGAVVVNDGRPQTVTLAGHDAGVNGEILIRLDAGVGVGGGGGGGGGGESGGGAAMKEKVFLSAAAADSD